MRTFIAVDLDAPIRSALVEIGRRADVGPAKVKWTAIESLHVTLHFLGELTDAAAAKLCEACRTAAAKVRPFDFDVRRAVSVPPSGRKVRMAWAEVDDPDGRLAELHARLGKVVGALGHRVERRPFRPHVTLARVRFAPDAGGFRQALAAWADAAFGRQHAEQVTVFSSDLTPTGPVYTPLAHLPLAGGGEGE